MRGVIEVMICIQWSNGIELCNALEWKFFSGFIEGSYLVPK